jgi:hypothetical protein
VGVFRVHGPQQGPGEALKQADHDSIRCRCGRRLAHDPEKLTDFSDKITRQNVTIQAGAASILSHYALTAASRLFKNRDKRLLGSASV